MLLNTFPNWLYHYHSRQQYVRVLIFCILQRASVCLCHSTFPWSYWRRCMYVVTHQWPVCGCLNLSVILLLAQLSLCLCVLLVWYKMSSLLCVCTCVRVCVRAHVRASAWVCACTHLHVCACAHVSPICKFTNIRVTVMLSCGFPLQTLLLYHGNI